MKTNATATVRIIAALPLTAAFLSGFVTAGQIGQVFSQKMSNQISSMSANMSVGNMTGTSSNASSMKANITESKHASNMMPEKAMAPNGTAPS